MKKKTAFLGFALMFAIGFVSTAWSHRAQAESGPTQLTCQRCLQFCDVCVPDPAHQGNCICEN